MAKTVKHTDRRNIEIRPATKNDVAVWYELLIMSSPSLEQIFGEKTLKRMFNAGGNLFSRELTTFIDVDGAPAAMMLGYNWRAKRKYDLPTGYQVLTGLKFKIVDKLPVMLRCLGNIGVVNSYEYFISNLAVLPGFRSAGLGKMLLDEAERLALECGAKHISIEVEQDNGIALKLYQKNGFQIEKEASVNIGERKHFYRMLKNIEAKQAPQKQESSRKTKNSGSKHKLLSPVIQVDK